MKLRWLVTSLVIFAMLTGLAVQINKGLIEDYSIIETDLSTNEIGGSSEFGAEQNIAEMLNSLNIIEGMDQISSSVVTLQQPTSTQFDVLGALASASVGVLQTITGLLTFPFEIGTIILKFYHIPNIIIVGLNLILVLLVSFHTSQPRQ